jgi:hypothetical protein
MLQEFEPNVETADDIELEVSGQQVVIDSERLDEGE